jgi:hypothetical protein
MSTRLSPVSHTLLVLAQGMHPRLGRNSIISSMSADLMRSIARAYEAVTVNEVVVESEREIPRVHSGPGYFLYTDRTDESSVDWCRFRLTMDTFSLVEGVVPHTRKPGSAWDTTTGFVYIVGPELEKDSVRLRVDISTKDSRFVYVHIGCLSYAMDQCIKVARCVDTHDKDALSERFELPAPFRGSLELMWSF